MYPFFETLRIEDKKVQNIPYHQERINTTFKVFYPEFTPINLNEVAESFPPEKKKTKCKLSYNATFFTFECKTYEEKIHNAFKIINADGFDYSFKFTKRDFFKDLKNKYPDHELIFVQGGKVTDTTYSNLIFSSGDKWFTPSSALLKGTQREKLLQENKIHELEIDQNELKDFKKFKLINAMLDIEHTTEYYTDMIENL